MPSSQQAHGRHARFYLTRLRRLDEDGSTQTAGGDAVRRAYYQDWPQIKFGQAWSEQHLDTDDAAAQLCGAYAYAGSGPEGASVRDLFQSVDERVRWLRAGRAAAEKLHDTRAQAVHCFNLGITLLEAPQCGSSVENLDESRRLFHELGDRESTAIACDGLAGAWQAIGNYERTVDHYGYALAVYRKSQLRHAEAWTLKMLGLCHSHFKEQTSAVTCLEESVVRYRELGDSDNEVEVLVHLASAHESAGAHAAAVTCYQRAVSLLDRDRADMNVFGSFYRKLGRACLDLGETAQALGYLQQDIEHCRQRGNTTGEGFGLLHLGMTCQLLSDNASAVQHLEQALTKLRKAEHRLGEGLTLRALGNAYQSLDTERAETYLRQSVDFFSDPGSESYRARAAWDLSRFLDKIGHREEAVELAEAALKLFDTNVPEMADKVRSRLSQWRSD